MSYSPELLSIFDPRFLEHRKRDLSSLEEFRSYIEKNGPPTAVEIGANRGRFLVGVARQHAPGWVLGFEWKKKFALNAEERASSAGYPNTRVLAVDAKLGVIELLPPESLVAVYVMFPDPWWKKGHHSRRLLDGLFLRVLARRLKPDGRLYLKSDVFDYLHRVRALADLSEAFEPLPSAEWPDESEWTLSTRERKCRDVAFPYGRGYYRRKPSFDITLPSEPEDGERFELEDESNPAGQIRGRAPAEGSAGRGRRARS